MSEYSQNHIFVAGIDVGSSATKAVLLDKSSKALLAYGVVPTGWNSTESAENALSKALYSYNSKHNTEKNKDHITFITATGYGRVSLSFAQKAVTEITCHAKGAHFLFPQTRTIIDIGGQDSKVIHVSPEGDVTDFIMNDKCAAGTGRFLQVLAGTLHTNITDLDTLITSYPHIEPATISSMCAVFAETEIIGLLAQNVHPAAIASGVFLSIAKRIKAQSSRLGLAREICFTGGLALFPSFAYLLAKELNAPLNIPQNPQITGALGAALISAK